MTRLLAALPCLYSNRCAPVHSLKFAPWKIAARRDTFIHHAAPSTCNALKNDAYLAVDSWYIDVHFTIGLSAISWPLRVSIYHVVERERERKERHPAAAVPITCDPSLFQIGNADSIPVPSLVLFELGSRPLVSHILEGIPSPSFSPGITVRSLSPQDQRGRCGMPRETNPRLSASTVLIGAVINYFRRGYLAICSRHSSLFHREPVVGRSLHDERRDAECLGSPFFRFTFSKNHLSLN